MTQPWKKQLHRKLLASTAVLVGASIALPVIGATTHSAWAAPYVLNGGTDNQTSVTATNTNGNGVAVSNGGVLTVGAGGLDSTTSATHNSTANAVNVTGAGSSVTLNGNASITADASTLHSSGINLDLGGNFTAYGVNNTVTINALGLDYAGITIIRDGTFTSQGTVTINPNGGTSDGVDLTYQGGSANFNNLNINTQEGGLGIYVENGAQLSVNTLHVTTTGGPITGGTNAYGVNTKNAGTKVTIGSGTITTSAPDPNAYASFGNSALRASDQSEIDVLGNITLDTSIVSGEGVNATGGATIILGTDSTNVTNITTHSAISDGISVGRLEDPQEKGSGTSGSSVISNGALNITTDAATSFGIRLTGDGATFSQANTPVTPALNALPNTITSDGTVIKFQTGTNQSATLYNTKITNTGDAGVYGFSGGPAGVYGTNNGQITDLYETPQAVDNAGNLFQVGGVEDVKQVTGLGPGPTYTPLYQPVQDNSTNSSLSLYNSVATAGGGKLLMDVRSSGATGSTFTFNNDHTELHGGVATQAGSTLAMNLNNGSSWYIDQNSNLTNLTNDGSAIIFDNNASFKTLTVSGNYTGSNNASLLLNTQLGNDSSPTDQLIVNGTVNGTTGLYIVNKGGGGAQTTGNGIEVINAANTTATSFSLQNAVNAGLFNYNLFRGGTTANAATDNDWFLRSSYRNEAPVTAALPVMSWQVVLSMLPTLHDRMPYVDGLIPQEPTDKDDHSQTALAPQVKVQNASPRNDYGAPSLQNALYNPNIQQAQIQNAGWVSPSSNNEQSQQTPALKGVWARLLGQDLKFQSHDGAGSGFDGNIWGLQAGLDFYAKVKDNGSRQFAGAYLANASSSGDVLSNAGKIGSLDLDATSLGLYYTNYSPEGWYLDGLAQYSWLRNIKARTGNETIEPSGSSYTLSLEAGKQLYRDRSVILEPQAQLIYSRNSLDDVTLSDNTVIHIASLNAVTGRFGARIFPNPNRGNNILPWAKANVWHTFTDNSTISSSGVELQTPINGTVGELAAGFSTRPGSDGHGWSFNASLGYLFNLGGADYSGLEGSLGIRKNW